MDSWPSALQQKLNANDFTLKTGNTLVRSDNDAGPAKVRSRFTDGVDQYDCSINLDIDDFDTLNDFYKTILSNGSLSFLATNPFTNTSQEFRFLAPPAYKPMGGRIFRVTMSWERIP